MEISQNHVKIESKGFKELIIDITMYVIYSFHVLFPIKILKWSNQLQTQYQSIHNFKQNHQLTPQSLALT